MTATKILSCHSKLFPSSNNVIRFIQFTVDIVQHQNKATTYGKHIPTMYQQWLSCMVVPSLCLMKFAHVKPIANICMMLRAYTDSGPFWIQKILESCSFVISMCKSKFMLPSSIVWFLYQLANFMPSLTLIYGLTEADFMRIIQQKR